MNYKLKFQFSLIESIKLNCNFLLNVNKYMAAKVEVNKNCWYEIPFIAAVKVLNDFPNHDIDTHYVHPISQI